MKTAIVHDWLDKAGGAEKVLAEMLELLPDADLYAIVDYFSEEDRDRYLKGKEVKTTFIQRLPGRASFFRNYLPLFPAAIESLDLREYDLIVSSSWAFAKGVKTSSGQYHLSYCYTPIRYAWDLYDEYLSTLPALKRPLVGGVLKYIRSWDRRTTDRVDTFLADSRFVAERIFRTYGRTSRVVYPPVDIGRFSLEREKEEFYLTASRLVPYKKTRLIVESFNKMPRRRLKVVGQGEEYKTLKRIAGPNIEILGYLEEEELIGLMQRARGFVYAALEDFGIVPVEAMACGTPVIALGQGGTAETVVDGETGVHFTEQTVESLQSAIGRFEKLTFDSAKIREKAEEFSRDRFLAAMREELKAFL